MTASVEYVLDRQALDFLLASPSGPVAQEIAVICQAIVSIAKVLAPVDTGRLRASITFLIGSDGAGIFGLVGTNVEYAPYQEFGTFKMQATPFLLPALLAVRSQYSFTFGPIE